MKTLHMLCVAVAAAGLLVCDPSLAGGLQGEPGGGAALSRSADAGRVLDREGLATRRAVLADRSGPLEAGTPLEVGDWLEVGSRGANALKVRLAGGAELVLGPGTQVEVAGGASIELNRGEVRVAATAGDPVAVGGPGDTTIRVDGRAVLRAADGGLERLERDPRWLTGYESNASTEALGSLLATVEGRNVPLTIGYHKVTVDVRDGIARTVVEESFENHTSTVLEGIFYFPLPADASISGFGMWIDGELVQGDIVEKERARAIYETILSERRDPGLLEWTGGNLFKARIFPIGAEKRIRIAYTQVLRREGDGFAYHYALESELLRTTPLRRLEITVDVSSTVPLAAVECPSHAARIRQTEHAAHVDFAAEEFAPQGDFELRVTTAPRDEPLALIPHRRGDDGYFMLLVDAPGDLDAGAGEEGAGGGSRPTEPIELLILADTSGSMGGPPRAAQVAFVEALIAALGERDTFDLATSDVETRWAFGRPVANDRERREQALVFLEERDPLGWTDLDRAFAAARERAGPRTHVVYVGDGVPSTGSADPVELAHALERSWTGDGTFHAVVPGPSSEMVVLRALTALGGGSLRQIGGGTDPAQTAFALLAEIAAPGVVDLAVTFEGLPVAAVYPERLPNLTAGSQQVLVGRFDPTGGDLSGRVVVTGTVDGQEVRLARDVTLAGDDEGNSFVPRLWARHHLDHLLDQGASDDVRERIVALSEDFQIVTPYTSFLVLESDADRERFGVERRFRMRDGEAFFADGRAAARHELLREQMLAARKWRRRMRAEIIASLEDMRREATELLRGGAGAAGGLSALGYVDLNSLAPSGGGDSIVDNVRSEVEHRSLREGAEYEWSDLDVEELFADEGEADPGLPASAPLPSTVEEDVAFERVGKKSAHYPGRRDARLRAGESRRQLSAFDLGGLSSLGYYGGGAGPSGPWGWRGDPFGALFPTPGATRATDPEWTWPDEVIELLARLDRRRAIVDSEKGWRFDTAATWTDPRGREQTTHGRLLVGPDRWVTVATHVDGYAYPVEWTQDGRRGVLLEGWRLGRTRAASVDDAASWSAPFGWHFGDQIRSYHGYQAELTDPVDGELADGRARVVFSVPTTDSRLELVIDVERGVLLEETWTVAGERTRGHVFEDFREIGGLWWPTAIRSWNTSATAETVTRIDIAAVAPPELARLCDAELVRRENAILLDTDAVEPTVAKQAVADGAADLDAHWALLVHYAATQRWERAEPHFTALAELAGPAPGLVPIRLVWLRESRRREELGRELRRISDEISRTPREAEYGLATDLMPYATDLTAPSEVLAVLTALEPVFRRQPQIADAELSWERYRLQALARLDRPEELFRAYRAAATAWPWALDLQTGFAGLLAGRGEIDAAIGWLASAEAEGGPWLAHERNSIRNTLAEIQWNGYRLEAWIETFEAWEREDSSALDSNLCSRYLAGLVYLDREAEARRHLEAWLALAKSGRDEPGVAAREPFDQARLHAAIQLALGQGHRLYHQRFDDRDAELLARTARALAPRENDAYLAAWILQHGYFRETDAGRAVLGELFDAVASGTRDLPAQRLSNWIGWLRVGSYQPTDGEATWEEIFERTFARWQAHEETAEDADLARSLLGQILLAHGGRPLRIRVFRTLLGEARSEADRITAANGLATELLQEPWTTAIEDEIAGLVGTLERADDPAADVLSANVDRRILLAFDLSSWILSARTEAIVTALPGYESMSRRTLADERATALATARAGAAERMAAFERTLAPAALAEWAAIERVWLQVENRSDLDLAWTRSLDLLGRATETLVAAESPADVPPRTRILAERCIATAAFLLVLGEAGASEPDTSEPAESEPGRLAQREARLRAVLERLATDAAGPPGFPNGRAWTRDVLIALDRGDELEAALELWFDGGDEVARLRWGRDRAHVLAERGRLEEAANALEEIGRLDELEEPDLRALAGWYTALDRPDEARSARTRSYEVLGDDALASDLYRRLSAYQRQGPDVPAELDPEIPVRFVAMMRKAARPENRLWVLRGYYEATADFRLLQCLPDAVLGHSAQGVYGFLTDVGSLAQTIVEEATVDSVVAGLEAARARAETDVDRRALWLLEFQVVLRAARQTHGTERHAERSLSALQAAFPGDWAEGEVVLLANFLARQGRLEPAALAAEQLRQLRALTHLAVDADERLAVAAHLAEALWRYDEHEAALAALEAALTERRSAAGGRLPESALDRVATLSQWLVALSRFRRAEALWQTELLAGHPALKELWLSEQLYGVWRDAVLARGDASLGSGEGLYAAVVAALERDLEGRTNEQHAARTTEILCDLWHRAHRDLHDPRAARDAGDFAFGQLPAVLDLYQYRGGQSLVGRVADCLREVGGAATALELLVVRAETEPGWLRLQNQAFWRQHAWRFGQVRADVGEPAGTLLRRALAIVLAELREDLRTRQSYNRTVYDGRYGHYWSSRRADFLATALEFLAHQRDSSRAVAHAAEYLHRGLAAHDEAVAALADAWRRGILHLEGRDQLATYLQELERWAESIPVAAELVADQPTEARYRAMLMLGHFHVGDGAARDRVFAAAEAWLRENGAFSEAAIATLADACLATELLEDSVRLFDDAIALHVRTAPRRGVGDGVLSNYYRQQSGAYVGLGRTDAAVDAAAGAIVSWGGHVSERQRELENLVLVLERSEDLEGYVERLDREVADSGLENPIVRKALGQVWLRRKDPARAAVQLRLALAARPADTETSALLLEACDRMERPDLAVAALLEQARAAGHELSLFVELGGRLVALGQPERAERALTMLVELSPHESEGHRALAEVREGERRWDAAVLEWRAVVRIRTKEPDGHLGLARALFRAGRPEEACTVLDHVRQTSWPARFGDAHGAAEALLAEIGSAAR